MQTFFNHLSVSLLRFVLILPYAWIIQLGHGLGWIVAHVPSDRQRVVLINLRLCFPQLSTKEIRALALQHWQLFGRSILERSRI